MNENALSLLIFAVAMTVSPGSNNVLLASSGVQVGMRRSVTLGLGIAAGIVVLLSVAALGLGTLVHEHPSLRTAMQAAGSAYLVWLGWKIAHAGAPDLSNRHAGRGNRRGFTAGFINTMLNPKGWTMALSAAAGYTALAPSAPRLALLLSLVFIAVFVPNWVLWTGGGQAIGRSVQNDRHWTTVNRILGLLVVVSIVPMWLE
ncbi:MAG: LysE family translocator [Thermomicrobiales bacterium]